MSQFKLVCLLGLSQVLFGCGSKQPTLVFGSSSAEARVPGITEAQLRMIESSDQSLSNLGWASISANVQLGASPTGAQLARINAQWRSQKTPVSAKAMHLLKDASFGAVDRLLSDTSSSSLIMIDDSKFLDLFNSTEAVDQEMASQLLQAPEKLNSGFSYSQFLDGSVPSAFKSDTLAPFVLGAQPSWVKTQTSPSTELAISPGKLKSSAQAITQISQRRSDGGDAHMTVNVTATQTGVMSIEELSRETSVNQQGFTLDKLLKPFQQLDTNRNIECAVTRMRNHNESSGYYLGNGVVNADSLMAFTCASLSLADAPAVPQAHSTRYQLAMLGMSGTIAPGNYSDFQPFSSRLADVLAWYDEAPFIQSTFTQQVEVSSAWIGIKLSKKLSSNQFSNYVFPQYPASLGTVQCTSGCLYPSPISQSSDGVLLFALSGTGSATFSVQTPVPFIGNAQEQVAILFNMDVIETGLFQFENVTDPAELPQVTQSLQPSQTGRFFSLWSTALSSKGWSMPEMEQTEVEGPITLHRLSLMSDLVKSEAVKAVFPTIDSTEFRTSLLAAHARNNMILLEKDLMAKSKANVFLVRIEGQLNNALSHLDHLSADEAYQLLGSSSSAVGMDNPELILDQDELTESVVGAWQMVHDELSANQASVKILCDALSKMTLSVSENGNGFIQQPRQGSTAACSH